MHRRGKDVETTDTASTKQSKQLQRNSATSCLKYTLFIILGMLLGALCMQITARFASKSGKGDNHSHVHAAKLSADSSAPVTSTKTFRSSSNDNARKTAPDRASIEAQVIKAQQQNAIAPIDPPAAAAPAPAQPVVAAAVPVAAANIELPTSPIRQYSYTEASFCGVSQYDDKFPVFTSFEKQLNSDAKFAALVENEKCYWAVWKSPPPLMKKEAGYNVCTHDPEVDTVISKSLHLYHTWLGSHVLKGISMVTPCTREQPFILDVGGNIGTWSFAFLDYGCHVIAFEPLIMNIARIHKTVQAAGWSDRIHLFKNAVGDYRSKLTLRMNRGNPGASKVVEAVALEHKEEDADLEIVHVIRVDDLFEPGVLDAMGVSIKHPYTGEALKMEHIHMMKVDTEGYDLMVLAGAQKLLSTVRPVLTVELSPRWYRSTSPRCDIIQVADYLIGLGYQYWEKDFAAGLILYSADEIRRQLNASLYDSNAPNTYEGFWRLPPQ